MAVVIVWTCGGGDGTTIPNQPYGLVQDSRPVPYCASGGQWVQIETEGGTPSMDIIAIGIVVGMCICAVLGFIAGQQR